MRIFERSTAIGLLSAMCLIGCDQAKQADHPTTAPTVAIAPTTVPANRAAAIDPATTEPATAFMMIDQHRVEFPPARLRVQKIDGRVIATLYSDDPKDALDDKYRGNGFYFEMPLDVGETTFDQATWYHHAETVARVETPYGIFLDGHRVQLQPSDDRIRITTGVGGLIKVEVSGTFLSVNTQDDTATPKMVSVAAWLMAEPVATNAGK